MGEVEEAEKFYRYALTAREAKLGMAHADTLWCLDGVATCLEAQSKVEEAKLVRQRAFHLPEATHLHRAEPRLVTDDATAVTLNTNSQTPSGTMPNDNNAAC